MQIQEFVKETIRTCTNQENSDLELRMLVDLGRKAQKELERRASESWAEAQRKFAEKWRKFNEDD